MVFLNSPFKMAEKATKKISEEAEVTVDEGASVPPVQGPSNVIKVTTREGKVVIVKREGEAEVKYKVPLEKPDLWAFKECPIEKFSEAANRKYSVTGIEMESEYVDMTEEEEEEIAVSKLSKQDQLAHKEMKDLMMIQGQLKGTIPGFGAGIHAYVTGRYPGVPSECVKPYVVEETGKKADLLTRLPPAKISSIIQEHDRKIPKHSVMVRPGRKGITMSIDPNSDDEVYEINEIEDTIETVIKITGSTTPKQED